MKRKLRFSGEIKRGIRLIAFVFSFLVLSSDLLAQSRDVSGTVTSSDDNTTVPGVNIIVKGTTNGTTTDANGKFTLRVDDNSTVLEISSIGYATQQIAVGTQSMINVVLVPEIKTLSEIVVIGYGTQLRKDVTGSISSVTAATLEKTPVTTVDQALQGRAAGVQIINNDASPGANVSVLVRGIGSLAPGGNNPLYVVDGYPTSDGLNNINPNDIASIDVLKDASATAIYGVRAANGVVIITTKKGFKDKIQLSLDAYTSVQSKPKKYDLLNAQDWATLSQAVEEEQATPYTGMDIWDNPESLHTVDWQDAMYRTGITQNYSIGIRGGNEKAQTAVSLGHYDQKGIVLGSYFKRFTAGLNVDYQPIKWLKSSTSIKYTYQDSNNPYGTGSLFNLVTLPPTLDGGNNLTYEIKDGNGNYGFYNPEQPNVSKFGNPVYTVETNSYENITNYVLAGTSLEATLFSGFKVKSNIGVNLRNFSSSFFQPSDIRANSQYPGAVIGAASYRQTMNNNFEWLWENTVAYDKTFGDHTINFVGGVSAQKNKQTAMAATGIPPNNTTRDLAASTNVQFDAFGNGRAISSLASTFARLTYQFADKYMITGTIRRDGSSKFAKGNKYGTFPSGSVAWRIKNESFLQNVELLSDLKLRASWGRVGNQSPIPLFQYQSWYVGNFPANYNGGGKDNLGYPFNKVYQFGAGQIQPANPNLKWETDEQVDIGLDAGFLDDRLTVTIDWFDRDSKDFLLYVESPAQTGYLGFSRNVGSMKNRGLEFALNYTSTIGDDFKFGAGLTVTKIKNTLTSITSGTTFVKNAATNAPGGLTMVGQGWDEFSRSYVGLPVGEFFGYKSLGIFQTQEQIDALNAAAPGGVYYRAATSPGDRYFADINGDGKVDAEDRTSIGSPQPKFFAGLNLDGTYKGFDFNLYFYGSFGNKILNYVESHLQSFQKRGSEGVQNVSQEYYNNYWTPERPSNTYARALANDDNTLNSVPSDAWVEDGSFVKLKNITVGYTIPGLLEKYSISKLRVYVSSQNLFWITKYNGVDPEIGIQNGNATQNGVDNGVYPSSKTFTFGLNLTF
jgi:TonB-dependent starch-binding outer membrane protein SusC